MAQYINKSAVVAEIERRRDAALMRQQNLVAIGQETILNEMVASELNRIISFLGTLEVKEIKLPNPRFPHLNNIVDKVFGIGNLESLEYEEAEQLVLLAKEELLKDLEVKEVDFEKEIDSQWKDCTPVDEGMGSEFANISIEQFANIAKHFYELGLKAAQK